MNVRRMDSHGGWLATPADLVRFLVHVDKFPTKADILKPATIEAMTTASTVDPSYARGWRVNKHHHWWHTGGMSGTAAIMVRTSHQFCWAALANTRAKVGFLDKLMWKMVGKIRAWPGHDLFGSKGGQGDNPGIVAKS